jgi:ABC-2 type transport system ATP-binding protein
LFGELAVLSTQIDNPSSNIAIQLNGVSKSFRRRTELGLSKRKLGPREVLRNVTLDVAKGEIVCILGKNGSGKTTLTRILSTLILPDRGEASICGFNVVTEGRDVRRRIGVLLNAGDTGFQSRLSGLANLEYYAALYQIHLREASELIVRLLSRLELDDRGPDQYQSYSTGMRRRLGLARALLPNPPVLLLDEPTLGVDPWSTKQIHKILKDLSNQGKSILCTTNNLSEAEKLGDRILTLEDGVLSSSRLEEVEAS